GQIVDCYLTPAAASGFGPSELVSDASAASDSNCWLSAGVEPSTTTQKIIKGIYDFAKFPALGDPSSLTTEQRLDGLGHLVVIVVILAVLGSALTGLTFYSMTWAGQHVLASLREELFRHLHKLPIGFYAENEVG